MGNSIMGWLFDPKTKKKLLDTNKLEKLSILQLKILIYKALLTIKEKEAKQK
ncbi:MAG: hypothetical protein ACFE8A_13310 [Candidatus Hodarchaeota archaeon]